MLSSIKHILFRSLSQKSYYNGRYSKEEYYGTYCISKTYAALQDLFNRQQKETTYSNLPIHFKFASFGATLKVVQESIGAKMYKYDNTKVVAGHNIASFRTTIGGFKVNVQLHFLHNKFIMGKYIFKEFNTTQLYLIKGMLSAKYHIPETQDLNQVYICDKDDNRIFMEGNSFCTIYYLSGEKYIQEQIRSGFKNQQNKNRKKDLLKISSLYASL